MVQAPAIILDSSVFNTSSSWTRSTSADTVMGYKNMSVSLSQGSSIESFAGNVTIQSDAQDVLLSLDGQFANSQCSLTISDASSPSVIGDVLPPISISDNILWDTAASRINMPLMLDINITGCSGDPLASLSLYYALITPTPTMALNNQLLFVNYTDTTIVYKGQWRSLVSELIDPIASPTKSSTTAGDIMKFPFTGWNVTLLGPLSPGFIDTGITLGVTVDEQAQIQLSFDKTATEIDYVYFEFFTLVQESDSGNHTITVEVLEIGTGDSFDFHGFTYIPGFDTLNDMPDLSVSISPNKSHGLHGGAIAGVVVGVIAGICLVGLILWAAIRRSKRSSDVLPAQPQQMESALVSDAYIPPTLPPEPSFGPGTITFSEKGYSTLHPPDASMATNAHTSMPFTQNYNRPPTLLTSDSEQPAQGSTVILSPAGRTTHVSSLPAEPQNSPFPNAPAVLASNDTARHPEQHVLPNNDAVALPLAASGNGLVSAHPDQLAAELLSIGNSNSQNGDQNRISELILDRLNTLMHAIQQPPAYEPEASP
ncbi:hypothetical protein BDP27DRAFT_1451108 [Rhodocollybia butyracea]|uniref:Peptidase A1 domain-containing protein n=1 Tax=Rhodocollybia butyracea TaxID=206335 RepID=A0A9P5PKK7_9AGAR|nr:hypothetical protein BDP27DRAFT_1451108 [Rhodocollybia butyracea]